MILDEINYAVKLGLVEAGDVAGLIRNRPRRLNLVLTGNHAEPEVLEMADPVTEMREIKHPFRSGVKARRGIDF